MVKIPFSARNKPSAPLAVKLSHYQWRCVVKPQVEANLLLNEQGLNVGFFVHESSPLVTVTKQQEPPVLTCLDSAVEIFLAFSPFEHDSNFKPRLNECLYTNIEVNAAGICYGEYGIHRSPRQTYSLEQIKSLSIKSSIAQDCWTCNFVVPSSLVKGLIGYNGFNDIFGINLYKISETFECEHYVSWQKVGVAQPNFHVPEFFALASKS